jgi:excinuclease UvrABC nuclease subunit
MADKATMITVPFDSGYFREPNVASLPTGAGVYSVYTCTYNKDDKPKPTVSVAKLVYIGEAGDIRDRVTNHGRWDDWKKHLAKGQIMCVAAAQVSPQATRQRAEAALIFKHKPP